MSSQPIPTGSSTPDGMVRSQRAHPTVPGPYEVDIRPVAPQPAASQPGAAQPADGQPAAQPADSEPAASPRTSPRFVARSPRFRYVPAMVVSLLIAWASLPFLPDAPAYDGWSWLVWGRQLSHLTFSSTNAGSSVKPLPIVIDAVLSVLGRDAPVAWMVVARAGAIMALLLAFHLGRRLSGVVAGVIAAFGLATAFEFVAYLAVRGMSEPLEAALALAAVDAHLRRRRWLTLGLLTLGALSKIEVSAFLVIYVGWCLYRYDRPLLTWAVAGASLVLIAAGWFGLDLWGAGDAFRSASTATKSSVAGALLAQYPGLATLKEAAVDLVVPIRVAFVIEFGQGLAVLVRRHRLRPTFILGLAALAWIIGESTMAQLGLATGAPRYLIPGLALASVVAGCGCRDLIVGLARWGRLPAAGRALAVGVVAVVLVVGSIEAGPYGGRAVRTSAWSAAITDGRTNLALARQGSKLADELGGAVRVAGGRGRVLACGPVTGPRFNLPALAWALDVPQGTLRYAVPAAGTVFQEARNPFIPSGYFRNYHRVGLSSGPPGERWTVSTTCG
jgi:hypothetical protein